jgi:alkylation response protein AidB-like acyl-CoA dehydrogenase
MIDMSNISSIVSPAIAQSIKNEAAQAEKQGKLTSKQGQLIIEQGWFKALVPSIYGGRQMPLPELIKLEEYLAYLDGSFGWVVTLCSGAGWFAGFAEEGTAKEYFAAANVCAAGSGAITGTATETPDGYLLNGKWGYASGASTATVFTVNCKVMKGNEQVLNEDGSEKVLTFILDKTEVTVNDDWNAFGMVATGSNSFEVNELKVPVNRAFDLKAQPAVNAALYHFPFMQLAECTLSVNITGMTMHFMELCREMIEGKSNPNAVTGVQDRYEQLSQKLETSRQKLFYAVDMAWQVCMANKEISPSLLYKITAASSIAVSVCRDCVNILYPYCGLKAANKKSEINRVWRDIQTACQHSLIASFGD